MSAPNEVSEDRKVFLRGYLEKNWLGSNEAWYIFNNRGVLWLGVRQHDLGGTDYDYKEKVTLWEAEWLLQQEVSTPYKTHPEKVYCFSDALKDFRKPKYEQVQKALNLALCYLGALEPGDSRAVSNEFVAMACVNNGDAIGDGTVMKIIEDALAAQKAKAEAEHNAA